jgi:hypothetical protein
MAWSIFKEGGGELVAVGWAKQFLNLLGAPDTPGNEQFIYQWEKAEGGGGKYNPLNQGPVAGKPYLTTTGEQFGGGAADFASWDAGLQGAVDFLHYKQYAGVLQGLMSNNPVSARNALWASPWAASHYGYGTNWPNVTLPGGQAVLPPTGGGEAGLLTGSTPDTQSLFQCAWEISLPISGDVCVLTNTQARSAFGIAFIILGFGIGVVAVAVLVANALRNPIQAATRISNRVQTEAGAE